MRATATLAATLALAGAGRAQDCFSNVTEVLSWAELSEELFLLDDEPRIIPDEILGLCSLRRLTLKGEQLVGVSHLLWQLPELRFVDLSDNLLESANLRDFDPKQSMLRRLDLSNNNLTEVGEDVFTEGGNLPNLQYLRLHNNQLTKMPDTFSRMDIFMGRKVPTNRPTRAPTRGPTLAPTRAPSNEFSTLAPSVAPTDYDPYNWGRLLQEEEEEADDPYESELSENMVRAVLSLEGNPWSCSCLMDFWWEADLVDMLTRPNAVQCGQKDGLQGRLLRDVRYLRTRFSLSDTPCLTAKVDNVAESSRNATVVWSHGMDQYLYYRVKELGNNERPFMMTSAVTGDFSYNTAFNKILAPHGCHPCEAADIWFKWPGDAVPKLLNRFTGEWEALGPSTRRYPGYQLRLEDLSSGESRDMCCYRRAENNRLVLVDLKPARRYRVAARLAHNVFDLPAANGTFRERTTFGYFGEAVEFDTDEEAPETPPRRINATGAVRERAIVLRWDPPEVPHGVIIGYELNITRNDGNEAGRALQQDGDNGDEGGDDVGKEQGFTRVIETEEQVKEVRDLEPGQSYWVRLRARTVVGWGPWSAAQEFRTAAQCSPGQRRGSSGECEACPLNSYGVNELGTVGCRSCPPDFPITVGEGSDSKDYCLSTAGSFKHRQQQDERRSCDERMLACDAKGLTERTIGVRSGFWRPTLDSLDLRACEPAAYCVGLNATEPEEIERILRRRLDLRRRGLQTTDEIDSDSAWERMREGDVYCADGHTGAMCRNCSDGYAMRLDGCQPCTPEAKADDEKRFGAWAALIVVLVCLPAARVLGSAWSNRHGDKDDSASKKKNKKNKKKNSSSRLSKLKATLRLVRRRKMAFHVKARVWVGMAQVLFQYVLIVSPERSSTNTVTADSLAVVFNLEVSRLLELANTGCFWDMSAYHMLLLYTAVPVACLLAMLVALACVRVALPKGLVPASVALVSTMLHILFFTYPGISSAIFRSFSPEEFQLDDPIGLGADGVSVDDLSDHGDFVRSGNVTRLLAEDLTIDFDSPESQAWRVFSAIMIAVYPAGVLLVFFVFATMYVRQQQQLAKHREVQELLQEHGQQKQHEPDAADSAEVVATAAQFLVVAYTPRCYWFESFDLVRKLLLTSVFVLVYEAVPDSGSVLFICITLVFLLTVAKIRPYRNPNDQMLAEIALGSIVLVAAISDLVVGSKRGPTETADDIAQIAIVVTMLVMLFAVLLAWRDWRRPPPGMLLMGDDDKVDPVQAVGEAKVEQQAQSAEEERAPSYVVGAEDDVVVVEKVKEEEEEPGPPPPGSLFINVT